MRSEFTVKVEFQANVPGTPVHTFVALLWDAVPGKERYYITWGGGKIGYIDIKSGRYTKLSQGPGAGLIANMVTAVLAVAEDGATEGRGWKLAIEVPSFPVLDPTFKEDPETAKAQAEFRNRRLDLSATAASTFPPAKSNHHPAAVGSQPVRSGRRELQDGSRAEPGTRGRRTMDSTVIKLIEKFDLQEEVEEFVRGRIPEIEQVTRFRLEGSPRSCANDQPHVPHIVDSYDTVRYGRLQYFCSGRSGDDLQIIYELAEPGSPELPAVLEGYWIRK